MESHFSTYPVYMEVFIQEDNYMYCLKQNKFYITEINKFIVYTIPKKNKHDHTHTREIKQNSFFPYNWEKVLILT